MASNDEDYLQLRTKRNVEIVSVYRNVNSGMRGVDDDRLSTFGPFNQ